MTIAVVNEEIGGGSCGAWSDGCIISSYEEMDMSTDWDDDWDDSSTVPSVIEVQ